MRKREFLEELRSRLSSLPKNEVDDRIDFYDEMIDDMIDEGKTEEEAIEAIGGIDGVMKKIAQDTSIVTIVKEKIKPKRSLRAWEVILLILGFPLWFPLVPKIWEDEIIVFIFDSFNEGKGIRFMDVNLFRVFK